MLLEQRSTNNVSNPHQSVTLMPCFTRISSYPGCGSWRSVWFLCDDMGCYWVNFIQVQSHTSTHVCNANRRYFEYDHLHDVNRNIYWNDDVLFQRNYWGSRLIRTEYKVKWTS